MVISKENLGERIKKERREKSNRLGSKITQEIMANDMNVSRSFLGDIERGRKFPNYDLLGKIAEYFGVTIDYLLGKSPFKTQQEAEYSIIVVAMKVAFNEGVFKSQGQPHLWERIFSYIDMISLAYTEETIQYIGSLLDKKDLSNIEYFDLYKFLVKDIHWPEDFNGPIVINVLGVKITAYVDYWAIPKIDIDESQSRLNGVYIPGVKSFDERTGNYKKTFIPDSIEQKSSIRFKAKPSRKRNLNTRIPVLGEIQDLNVIKSENNIDVHLDLTEEFEETFMIVVDDDSMAEFGIYQDDLIVCQEDDKADPGDIAVILNDFKPSLMKAVLRIYAEANGAGVFQSPNPNYGDIVADARHRIVGYPVALIRDLQNSREAGTSYAIPHGPWFEIMELAQNYGLTPKQAYDIIKTHITLSKRLKGDL